MLTNGLDHFPTSGCGAAVLVVSPAGFLWRRGQQRRHKPPMVLSWNSWNCPFTKRSTRLDFPTADSPKRTSLNWQILLPAFGPLGRVAPPLPAMSPYPVGRDLLESKTKEKQTPKNDLNRRKRTGQRLQSHSNAGASQREPEPDDRKNIGCRHLSIAPAGANVTARKTSFPCETAVGRFQNYLSRCSLQHSNTSLTKRCTAPFSS